MKNAYSVTLIEIGKHIGNIQNSFLFSSNCCWPFPIFANTRMSKKFTILICIQYAVFVRKFGRIKHKHQISHIPKTVSRNISFQHQLYQVGITWNPNEFYSETLNISWYSMDLRSMDKFLWNSSRRNFDSEQNSIWFHGNLTSAAIKVRRTFMEAQLFLR